MKKVLLPGFFFLFFEISHAATRQPTVSFDTFPLVKVVTQGGKIVIGQLQYITDSTIQILPGTRKEARKGYLYESVTLHYADIISFRVRTSYWFVLLVGLLGAVGLAAILVGEIPVFNNGLGEANLFIWLSPVFIGGSVWKMLQRKRFAINGNKQSFDKFRSWIDRKRDKF
ncbi:hypothetical protein [Lacibacter sp. H407]|uniref:hypothetical protein n=1 Tax=Lacibacter sp. H407 TaxID=3133423 RepID=UPI0030C2FC0C